MGGKGGGLGGFVGGMVDNTLGTSFFGQNANDRAKDAQIRGMEGAQSAIGRAYDDQKKALNPYSDLGIKSLAQLTSGNLMKDDPGYQFRLDEGNKSINSGLAARGLGNSGAAIKALTRYGQDYASGEYGNAFNRQMQMANMGLNAAGGLSNAASGYGENLANIAMGVGSANAGAIAGKEKQRSSFVDRLYSNAGAGMGMFSDSRMKKNIQEIDKKDLAEMKKHLKAYAFNYTSEEYGQGDWVGVMAQDLEKSNLGRTLVIENEKGQKTIDLKKVLSMFLAIMAEA